MNGKQMLMTGLGMTAICAMSLTATATDCTWTGKASSVVSYSPLESASFGGFLSVVPTGCRLTSKNWESPKKRNS